MEGIHIYLSIHSLVTLLFCSILMPPTPYTMRYNITPGEQESKKERMRHNL